MDSAVQPRLRKVTNRNKYTLTVRSGHKTIEEASFPVNLSVLAVGVPPTAVVRSVQHGGYSKTDPEVLMHLNLYGSQLADERALSTH